MPEGIACREFWVIISAVVELLGAIMILTNRMPRLGGWLIVLFSRPRDPCCSRDRDDQRCRSPDGADPDVVLLEGCGHDGRSSSHHSAWCEILTTLGRMRRNDSDNVGVSDHHLI